MFIIARQNQHLGPFQKILTDRAFNRIIKLFSIFKTVKVSLQILDAAGINFIFALLINNSHLIIKPDLNPHHLILNVNEPLINISFFGHLISLQLLKSRSFIFDINRIAKNIKNSQAHQNHAVVPD